MWILCVPFSNPHFWIWTGVFLCCTQAVLAHTATGLESLLHACKIWPVQLACWVKYLAIPNIANVEVLNIWLPVCRVSTVATTIKGTRKLLYPYRYTNISLLSLYYCFCRLWNKYIFIYLKLSRLAWNLIIAVQKVKITLRHLPALSENFPVLHS